MEGRRERIGLVLAGGGARGAYEAGVLSVLLPELERRGQRPTVIVGTSVGAINTAFLAATAARPAAEVIAEWRERWLALRPELVIRPVLGRSAPLTALRYLGEVLGVPGVRLPALLDPTPLRETLEAWVDWEALHRNVAGGVLDAVAVAGTAAASASSVVFVEGGPVPPAQPDAALEYLGTALGTEHVRASAAIPTLFPAVFVEQPPEGRGWYFDGGTRLNTPIKPALDLGVDRVVVVALNCVAPVPREPDLGARDPQPDFADGLLQLVQATLVDPVVRDVQALARVNALVGADGPSAEAVADRAARGRRPPRRVPYVFVSPPARDTIGAIAATVFQRRLGGLRGVRNPDIALLNRLLGGEGMPRGELLSYLFFDGEFARALLDQGERDARRLLASGELWRMGRPQG